MTAAEHAEAAARARRRQARYVAMGDREAAQAEAATAAHHDAAARAARAAHWAAEQAAPAAAAWDAITARAAEADRPPGGPQ